MPPDRAPPPLDHDALAEAMDALSYGPRLQLLDLLRFPHTLSEIKLPPKRASGGRAAAASAMPTVQRHLQQLVAAGFVKQEPLDQDGRKLFRYAVNPQKLYAFTEDLRRLSTTYAGKGLTGDATGTMVRGAAAAKASGPRLVLVHGVYEGKAFALTGPGPWALGRRKDCAVALDYDPFVSSANSEVRREGDRFTLHDLPGNKNGTLLNWEPLAEGGAAVLEPGDILGVGRSMLCFRR